MGEARVRRPEIGGCPNCPTFCLRNGKTKVGQGKFTVQIQALTEGLSQLSQLSRLFTRTRDAKFEEQLPRARDIRRVNTLSSVSRKSVACSGQESGFLAQPGQAKRGKSRICWNSSTSRQKIQPGKGRIFGTGLSQKKKWDSGPDGKAFGRGNGRPVGGAGRRQRGRRRRVPCAGRWRGSDAPPRDAGVAIGRAVGRLPDGEAGGVRSPPGARQHS